MDWISQAIEYVLHFDKYVDPVANAVGPWLYLILFAIVFCETGLVVFPFLPGDSLLFLVGALAARENSPFSLWIFFVVLVVAAILGDAVNYWIGYRLGPKVFTSETSKLLNKRHLQRSQEFYERYGGKTIVIARFVPIIRTFAPFVAGVGKMRYPRFLAYNVFGGIGWVAIFLIAGYFLGSVRYVQENFKVIVLAIIAISLMPLLIEWILVRRRRAAGSA